MASRRKKPKQARCQQLLNSTRRNVRAEAEKGAKQKLDRNCHHRRCPTVAAAKPGHQGEQESPWQLAQPERLKNDH
jgi:hypothetical protein